MGLAAGQARLLSITSRKADCEFQSMRLSHQKIALSRELADLSNEYQNSLDQTKLIYDYYGTGDTNTPLTYSILMTPSALNDYMPITLTDTSGRVTLNSKYAEAARAAGIPQEGLGTLPSETMRNSFIQSLANSGLIPEKTASTILGLPYNQAAGFGGGSTAAIVTSSGNVTDLISYISENCNDTFTVNTDGLSREYNNAVNKTETAQVCFANSSGTRQTGQMSMSLGQLLSDEDQYSLDYCSIRGEQTPVIGIAMMTSYLTSKNGFIDWLYNEFSSVLDLGDGYTGAALEYAMQQTKDLLTPTTTANINGTDYNLADFWKNVYGGRDWEELPNVDKLTSWKDDNYNLQNYINQVTANSTDKAKNKHRYNSEVANNSYKYLGFNITRSNQEVVGGDPWQQSVAAINLNNIAKAFLTYFADYMNGVSKKDSNGYEQFSVGIGALDNQNTNNLATDDYLYEYTWAVGSSVSSDDLGQATFYDTLFNQICTNGWTENNKIDDKDYLQQMLQSGMLYISKIKDDGFYYQANYATDAYIKEIADETYIAQAEAKYNTEKAKLNAKEETLDLKMKNLDTEISSLTTEYDTVKNTISKNIEKSFKRYNA